MADLLFFPAMAHSPDTMPNRIRHYRLRAKLTLEQLSELIGTSYVQLSRLETGKRQLTMDWLERLSQALDVPVADLLSRDQNPWALDDEERRLIAAVRATGGRTIAAVTNVAETMRGYQPEPEVLPFDPARKRA